MNSEPADPAADVDAAPGVHAERYRRVLHELMQMGTDIARALHQQVVTHAVEDGPPPDVSVAFDRVCRGVRRSILLARTLDAPAVPADAGRAAARRMIIRRLENQIDLVAEGERAERLHGELLERMDGPDLEADLLSRPVDAIVREICADLGLSEAGDYHPWKRRTPADVAMLCARAAAGPGETQAAAGGNAASGPAAARHRAADDGAGLAFALVGMGGRRVLSG